MKNFNNKIIVITGAGSGMGRAYAIEFAELGARLALNDYDKTTLKETVALAKSSGAADIFSSVFDVSDKDAVFQFADDVKSNLGNASVVINNAGIEGDSEPAYTMGIENYERVMQINYFGVLYGSKAFLPQLVENNEGALVNVSSVFGLIGAPNYSAYCSAKFAVTGFTETLMAEFYESPISIHCVHPGGIKTAIARNNSDVSTELLDKVLSTPPEEIVKYVIECIKKEEPRIVYGNQSFRAWFASNFIPTRFLSGIAWKEFKKIMSVKPYESFLGKNRNTVASTPEKKTGNRKKTAAV